jgi:RimJ/RimL family protein N-acetyltransferase
LSELSTYSVFVEGYLGGWQSRSLGPRPKNPRAVACLYLLYVSDNTGLLDAFNSAMDLTTERLILRQWRDADLAQFAHLNDDPVVMEFMPRRLTRDESDAVAARIRAHIEQHGWGLWAVEVKATGEAGAAGGPLAGYVGLAVPRFFAHPATEIGWRLAKEHWGRGYASEAATACLHFAFEQLKLEEVVSFTVPLNKRSIGVMERIGMTRNPDEDFDHPKLPPGHPLRRHVLYRMRWDS